MNAPTIDIKDLLVAEGLAVFKTNLFIAQFPLNIDNCFLLTDIAGRPSELNYEWKMPAIQLLTRGRNYSTTYNLAATIVDFLHGYQGIVNGANYKLIEQEGDLSWIGQDDEQRHIFSTRFQIQRTSA